MKIDFRYPTEDDIRELSEKLIPADRDEILAMGWDVEAGIRNSVRTSLEVVAIFADGELACITGICRTNEFSERVYPWLVSTPVALRHPREQLAYSKRILDHWLKIYPHMTNFVDQRHYRAVRWLRWLGAKLTPEPAFGPYKRPFYRFEFGDPNVH